MMSVTQTTGICLTLAFAAVGLDARAELAPTSATPSQLLQRMDDAFARLSYDGIFTFFDGTDMASLRLVHKVDNGVTRERLVHLTGPRREFLRHGSKVDCIVLPGDDLIEIEQSIPSGPFARAFVREFDRIADTYAVMDAGTGRVAGRDTRLVEVMPRDNHRYGFRLWIDTDSGLLLRSEMLDRYDRQLEIFMFTQVQIGNDVPDSALQAEQVTGSKVNHLTLQPADAEPVYRMAEDAIGVDQWHAGWLPPGFVMASMNQRHKPASDDAVNSLVYSDGLAAFSVFIESMPESGAATMVSTHGATVAMTHGLRTADGNYLLTLVGEVPVPTAQRIVESIYLDPP